MGLLTLLTQLKLHIRGYLDSEDIKQLNAAHKGAIKHNKPDALCKTTIDRPLQLKGGMNTAIITKNSFSLSKSQYFKFLNHHATTINKDPFIKSLSSFYSLGGYKTDLSGSLNLNLLAKKYSFSAYSPQLSFFMVDKANTLPQQLAPEITNLEDQTDLVFYQTMVTTLTELDQLDSPESSDRALSLLGTTPTLTALNSRWINQKAHVNIEFQPQIVGVHKLYRSINTSSRPEYKVGSGNQFEKQTVRCMLLGMPWKGIGDKIPEHLHTKGSTTQHQPQNTYAALTFYPDLSLRPTTKQLQIENFNTLKLSGGSLDTGLFISAFKSSLLLNFYNPEQVNLLARNTIEHGSITTDITHYYNMSMSTTLAACENLASKINPFDPKVKAHIIDATALKHITDQTIRDELASQIKELLDLYGDLKLHYKQLQKEDNITPFDTFVRGKTNEWSAWEAYIAANNQQFSKDESGYILFPFKVENYLNKPKAVLHKSQFRPKTPDNTGAEKTQKSDQTRARSKSTETTTSALEHQTGPALEKMSELTTQPSEITKNQPLNNEASRTSNQVVSLQQQSTKITEPAQKKTPPILETNRLISGDEKYHQNPCPDTSKAEQAQFTEASDLIRKPSQIKLDSTNHDLTPPIKATSKQETKLPETQHNPHEKNSDLITKPSELLSKKQSHIQKSEQKLRWFNKERLSTSDKVLDLSTKLKTNLKPCELTVLSTAEEQIAAVNIKVYGKLEQQHKLEINEFSSLTPPNTKI